MDQLQKEYQTLINYSLQILKEWEEPVFASEKNFLSSYAPPLKKSISVTSIPLPPKEKKIEKEPPPKPSLPKKEAPIELHPPPKPTSLPLTKMHQIFTKIAPHLSIIDQLPSDAKAKRLNEAWKSQYSTPDIPILADNCRYLPFLQNIAKAIDITFASSRVINMESFEKEKNWDLFFKTPNLKLIIIPDNVLWGAEELLAYYKEVPTKGVRTLGNIPLLLLPDLSLYFKDPKLKRSLWNIICHTLNRK